jgi:hypothetical protein
MAAAMCVRFGLATAATCAISVLVMAAMWVMEPFFLAVEVMVPVLLQAAFVLAVLALGASYACPSAYHFVNRCGLALASPASTPHLSPTFHGRIAEVAERKVDVSAGAVTMPSCPPMKVAFIS